MFEFYTKFAGEIAARAGDKILAPPPSSGGWASGKRWAVAGAARAAAEWRGVWPNCHTPVG